MNDKLQSNSDFDLFLMNNLALVCRIKELF